MTAINKGLVYLKKPLVGAALLSGSVMALAEPVPIDTTDVVAQLASVQTAIAAVGAGILVLAAISLGYRWVKASFF